jgi:hypothetical protein
MKTARTGVRIDFTLSGAAAILIAALTGCATPSKALTDDSTFEPQTQKRLEQRIQNEPSANTPDEIADRAAFDFVSAPGLSKGQKEKVMEVYRRTYQKALIIRTDIGKAKSLLFKTIALKDFSSGDIERLKTRIVELDQERLQIMFKALSDIQAVVGTGKDKEDFYKHFYDFEYPHHGQLSKAR